MTDPAPTTKWIVLGFAGAAVGATAFISIGELIRPSSAQSQTSAPTSNPNTTPPSPPGSVQQHLEGTGNQQFYAPGGNIYLNPPPQPRPESQTPSMRDPDGIYQLDQKVATVTGAEEDRGRNFLTFKELISQGGAFNSDKDFQYREYVLHLTGSDAMTGASISGLKVMRWINARCEIKGTISAN